MQQIDDFEISNEIQNFKNNPNCTLIFDCDFNAGDIEWDSNTVHEHSENKQINTRIVNRISDSDFNRLPAEPTRNVKILDNLCTNKHLFQKLGPKDTVPDLFCML